MQIRYALKGIWDVMPASYIYIQDVWRYRTMIKTATDKNN